MMTQEDQAAYDKALRRITTCSKAGKGGTFLDLSGLSLTTLPPEIGNLFVLRVLHLGNNQLTTLLPEIGKLSALTVLLLWNNQLTTLPPEIGKLSALTRLYLHNNQLKTLPPEIGKLSALTRLYLHYNQLKTLPPEIGNLSVLRVLHLGNNQLTTLPPEIGRLDDLELLHLEDNALRDLPESLRGLAALRRLDLHGNEGLKLPTELLVPSHFQPTSDDPPAKPQNILDYYFRRPIKSPRMKTLNTLRGDLRFHPVGQGLFYTGRIQFGKHDPNYFFYDCGSSTDRKSLKAIVGRWKQELENEKIALGIISHLDADHVNGLGTLLDGSVVCGTVILPYLSPWRRIAIAARSEDAPDDYFELMENPAQFLLSRRVDRVVFMGGNSNWGERPDPPGPINREGPPRGDNERSRLNIEGLMPWQGDDATREGEFVRTPGFTDQENSAVCSLAESNRISFVRDEGHAELASLWQFHFFQYGFDERTGWSESDRWDAFESEVKQAAGTTDPHLILGRLRNRKTRKRIREAYRHLQRDHNNASIAVWHGPIRGQSEAKISAPGFRMDDRHYFDAMKMNIQELIFHRLPVPLESRYIPGQDGDLGTLLTGDISLRHDFMPFWNRFQPFVNQTSVVSLPHHGAAGSWNPEFMDNYFNCKKGVSLFVASAGAKNSYGHPHQAVLSSIQTHYPVAKVTETDPGIDVAIECQWP